MTHPLPRLTLPGASRPSVLVVDDHAEMRAHVSRALSSDYDIAAVAGGGHEALALARAVDPDVVVLDMNMPDISGIETLAALTEAGCRAPVVFLSAVGNDVQVAQALAHGARGYVMKLRIARDLVPAIDHALAGRTFVPSTVSLTHLSERSGHAMEIHGGAQAWLDGLAAFFDRALRRGDATCVIATEDVREGLGARLQRRGWDVDAPGGHSRYLVIDADAALERFMRGGLPDRDSLDQIAAELETYRRTVEGGVPRVTIFGNMVMRLASQGNRDAIRALEHTWNQLTAHLPFFTLCAYSLTSVREHGGEVYRHACAEHAAVAHAADV